LENTVYVCFQIPTPDLEIEGAGVTKGICEVFRFVPETIIDGELWGVSGIPIGTH
jgi:hypothetical protein